MKNLPMMIISYDIAALELPIRIAPKTPVKLFNNNPRFLQKSVHAVTHIKLVTSKYILPAVFICNKSTAEASNHSTDGKYRYSYGVYNRFPSFRNGLTMSDCIHCLDEVLNHLFPK